MIILPTYLGLKLAAVIVGLFVLAAIKSHWDDWWPDDH